MIPIETALSNACYAKGEYRYAEDGRILNERGKAAKKDQVILRDARTGFVLVRMGDDGVPVWQVEDYRVKQNQEA